MQMPKGNTTPRTDLQIEKWNEYKNNCGQIGKTAEEKETLRELLHPFKKNNLNLSNIDASKLQNITKGAK